MSQLNLVCLSLTPNLRCVGFTLKQFIVLIIPPAIEGVVSLLFIYLYSGPGRRAQVFLAADSILYLIWALLDMLSHVTTVAQTSLSVFKALDFFVGAVSFTPILIYSICLYRLSIHDSIPNLPRKIQPYLEISLPILLVTAVVMNEVSSFVGTYLVTFPDRPVVIMFSDNSESLWLSLSQSSLTIYTIIQFLFFLLTFSRFSRAFLDQRRIELSRSDQHRYLYGLAWIAFGVIIGVIETLAGFAQVSFGVALARRILRLIARAALIFGSLKGCDVAARFENLTDAPGGVSGITSRFSRIFGVNSQQTGSFPHISQSHSERSRVDGYASAEKGSRAQRVTVRYETGQAPLLQIRFSTLDFPPQAMLPDPGRHRRRSLPGLIPGNTNGGGNVQHKENISNEMAATRNAMLETRRAKSALVANDGHHAPPDWVAPPEKSNKRASGETISDLSIVRELERRFPNLPPRVTGKYRGSILGQNYEEDQFPVVGISRQSSLRRDGGVHNSTEDGGAPSTLSPSSSIRRKPAPPLLENITHIAEQSKRPVSAWGELAQNTANHLVDPVSPNTPTGVTADSPDPPPTAEPTTPRSRRRTARDLIKRASRALSDASIRSAEWLASANSPQSPRIPLTAADIEMYRRGNLGPGSAPLTPLVGEAL